MKASISSSNHLMRSLLVVALSALACGSALAQWQWLDSTGRKVYSDTAPPSTIPDKNILKRPSQAASALAPEAPAQDGAATTAKANSPGAPSSGVDPKLEAKRKAAEEAESAKKKALEEKRNVAKVENCERAKRALATLNSGIRIRTTNSKGEADFLDDAARAKEVERLTGLVRADCGPLQIPLDVPAAN